MSDQANDLLNAEEQVRSATVVDVDTDRGTIDALIMTYEQRAQIDHDLYEVFTRGALASAISAPHRVKMSNQQHDMKVTIGRAIEIREKGDEVYGRLRIADTVAGRDVLTLLRADEEDGHAILDELHRLSPLSRSPVVQVRQFDQPNVLGSPALQTDLFPLIYRFQHDSSPFKRRGKLVGGM